MIQSCSEFPINCFSHYSRGWKVSALPPTIIQRPMQGAILFKQKLHLEQIFPLVPAHLAPGCP